MPQRAFPALSIISGDQAREMEPNVSDSVVAALYAPSGGIVVPLRPDHRPGGERRATMAWNSSFLTEVNGHPQGCRWI